MTINNTPQPTPDPRHVFLDIAGLMARYALKRTATYDLVKRPGFPGQVAPRRWRLDQVMAYEDEAGRTASPLAINQTDESDPARAASDGDKFVDILAPRRSKRKAA